MEEDDGDSFALVTVDDDGPGVDPADAESIFERHAGADTGIGLALGLGVPRTSPVVSPTFTFARAFRTAVDQLVQPWAGQRIDKVAGLEARGFILGGAVAHQLSAGFVPMRAAQQDLPGLCQLDASRAAAQQLPPAGEQLGALVRLLDLDERLGLGQVGLHGVEQRKPPGDVGDIALGDSAEAEMTVLFADIRGFSTLASSAW